MILEVSLLYQMIGAKYDDKEYPKIYSFFVYPLQTLRNTIGDIAPPEYQFWQQQNGRWQNFIIILIIWLTFVFINIVLLSVVLMNSLIAIVSDTFSNIQKKKTDIIYAHRA